MQIFNAKTQQLEDVDFAADKNHEIVATFSDGHFLKFPAGTTEAQAHKLIEAHRVANEGQEVITPEMEAQIEAERQASDDLAAKLNGNAMPKGNTTNDPNAQDPDTK
jgi:hypothetical protein